MEDQFYDSTPTKKQTPLSLNVAVLCVHAILMRGRSRCVCANVAVLDEQSSLNLFLSHFFFYAWAERYRRKRWICYSPELPSFSAACLFLNNFLGFILCLVVIVSCFFFFKRGSGVWSSLLLVLMCIKICTCALCCFHISVLFSCDVVVVVVVWLVFTCCVNVCSSSRLHSFFRPPVVLIRPNALWRALFTLTCRRTRRCSLVAEGLCLGGSHWLYIVK